MLQAVPKIVDDMRRGRVRSVSDDGEVVLTMANGKDRLVRIPLESVPLVRRLVALDRESERTRRRSGV
jgi:hypothetical protein